MSASVSPKLASLGLALAFGCLVDWSFGQLFSWSVRRLVGWLVDGFCTVHCMVHKCNSVCLEINYITELLLVLMKYYYRNPHKQAAPDVL